MTPTPQESSFNPTDLAGLNDKGVNTEVYDRLLRLNGTQVDLEVADELYEVTTDEDEDRCLLVFVSCIDPDIKVSIGFTSDGELSIANEGGNRIGAFSANVVERTLLELEQNREEKAKLARLMPFE